MATKDPVAAAAQKYKPMQSAVPGTTLGPIQIDAFLGAGVVLLSLCHFLIIIKIFCFFMKKPCCRNYMTHQECICIIDKQR